jgi:hypothetical protein
MYKEKYEMQRMDGRNPTFGFPAEQNRIYGKEIISKSKCNKQFSGQI